MNKKITLVTSPDDVIFDAKRILTYDLTNDQSLLVSYALSKIDLEDQTVVYVANGKDNSAWTLDKKQKSSIIVVNAEANDQTMVGYLMAQNNSYYIGKLRSLAPLQKTELKTVDELIKIMEDDKTKI